MRSALNVVIPAAGLGARLRPHTLHRPKALMHVGGDVMLGHVLRSLRDVDIDTICLVVGHLGRQLAAYAQTLDGPAVRVLWQHEPLGQAHAVLQARPWLQGPVLIAFPDTILDFDPADLRSDGRDGTLFAHDVDDPSRFGVVVTDTLGQAARLVEKPRESAGRQAVLGLYHVTRGQELARAIDTIVDAGLSRNGEYYLLDALQAMIDEGARFAVRGVRTWIDCGVPSDLLAANRLLLRRLEHDPRSTVDASSEIRAPVSLAADATIVGSIVGPRVFVGPGCRIEGSRIGPDVSLAAGATVVNSTIRDTVAESGVGVRDSDLAWCLLGRDTRVRDVRGRLSLGDGCAANAT